MEHRADDQRVGDGADPDPLGSGKKAASSSTELTTVTRPRPLAWWGVFLVGPILGHRGRHRPVHRRRLGSRPRDGLMTGLARPRDPAGRRPDSDRAHVLAIGFALGGSVDIGTVLFAVSIGPLVSRTLPKLAVGPQPQPEPA